MWMLSLELSTVRHSVAVGQDNDPILERSWSEPARASHNLIPMIQSVLSDAGVRVDQIDRFAAGVGPGTFSGLRIAVTTLQALALPGGKPVVGFSSAAVLAYQVAQGHCTVGNTLPVTVVGDARRGQLWFARYEVGRDDLQPIVPPRIAPAGAWPSWLQPAGKLVTPDWDRLGATLAPWVPPGVDLIPEPRQPAASSVLELARLFQRHNRAYPPPVPLYLNPPVAVPGPEKGAST